MDVTTTITSTTHRAEFLSVSDPRKQTQQSAGLRAANLAADPQLETAIQTNQTNQSLGGPKSPVDNKIKDSSQEADQRSIAKAEESQNITPISSALATTSTVANRQTRGPICDSSKTSRVKSLERVKTAQTDRSRRVQRSIDSRSILNNKERLKRFWEKRMEMEFKARTEQQELARASSLASEHQNMDQDLEMEPPVSSFKRKQQKGGPIRSADNERELGNFDENNNNQDNEDSQLDDYTELVSAELLCEKLLAVKRRQKASTPSGGQLGGPPVERWRISSKPEVVNGSSASEERQATNDQQPMSIDPVLCHLDEKQARQKLDQDVGGPLIALASCEEREEQSANEEFSSSNSSFGPMSISMASKAQSQAEDQRATASISSLEPRAANSSDDDDDGEEDEEETSTQSGSVLTVISSNNNNASDHTATTNQQRDPKTADQLEPGAPKLATGETQVHSLITSIEDHQDINEANGRGEDEHGHEDYDGRQSNVEEEAAESDGSNIGVAFESLQFDDEIKSSKNELVDEARLLANDHYGNSSNNNNGKSLQKVQAARRATTSSDKSSSAPSVAAPLRAPTATSEQRAEGNNSNNNNNNNRPMPKFNSREVKSVCSLITSAISDATKQVDDYIKSRARLGSSEGDAASDVAGQCASKLLDNLVADADANVDAGAGGREFRATGSGHRRLEGEAAGDADCEDEAQQHVAASGSKGGSTKQRRRLRPIEGFQRATFVCESPQDNNNSIRAASISPLCSSATAPSLQADASKVANGDDNENRFNRKGRHHQLEDGRPRLTTLPRNQISLAAAVAVSNGRASEDEDDEDNFAGDYEGEAEDDDEDDDDGAIRFDLNHDQIEVPRADLSSIFEANVRREIERFESNSTTQPRRQEARGGEQLGGGGKSLGLHQAGQQPRSGLTEWRIAEEIRLFNERENELKQRSGGQAAPAKWPTPEERQHQQQQLEPVVRFGKTLHIPKHSADKQQLPAQVQLSRSIKLTTTTSNQHNGNQSGPTQGQQRQQQQPTMISMHKFISSGGKQFVYQQTSHSSLATSTSGHQHQPEQHSEGNHNNNNYAPHGRHHLTKSMSNLSSLSSSSSSSIRTVDYRAVDSLRCKEVPNVKPGLAKKTIETFSRLTSESAGSLTRLDLNGSTHSNESSHDHGRTNAGLFNGASGGTIRAARNQFQQKLNGAEWKIQEELREMKAREAELRSLRNQRIHQQQRVQHQSESAGDLRSHDGSDHKEGTTSITSDPDKGYFPNKNRFAAGNNETTQRTRHQRTQSANIIASNGNHIPVEEADQDEAGDESTYSMANSEWVITMNGHQQQQQQSGIMFQQERAKPLTAFDGGDQFEETDSDTTPTSNHSLYPIKQTIERFTRIGQQ